MDVSIHPDWDTAISYDVLDRSDEDIKDGTGPTQGVFVGREDLLAPLVSALCEPTRRGTVLVSGYRGAGKTTLVIEALRQADAKLRKAQSLAQGQAPRLLPVVLNVSELAMASAPPAAKPDPAVATTAFQLDPKRLLIALIRGVRHAALGDPPARPPKVSPKLVKDITELYRKAHAAEYKLSYKEGSATKTEHSTERSLSLKADDLLKMSLVPTGLITAGLAALGAGTGVAAPWIQGVAATVGTGMALLGLAETRKRASTQSQSDSQDLAWTQDNSPQQLESDLKDLLQDLKREGLRTVIVLEELDKLDEQTGSGQLELIIRNFKNMFTQAPALFLFLTDKQYYDNTALKIRQARSRRSYAVEHTFFTQRLFIGRPSTRDCLNYLRAILVEDSSKATIDAIYPLRSAANAPRPRWASESFGADPSQPKVDALSLFARVMLFKACNHLFDLKNELQAHVRTDEYGRPMLALDDAIFPPRRQWLAKFQDLIADKFETFHLKGRSYHNEVLNDHLYGVFDGLGHTAPRGMDPWLPTAEEHALDPGELRNIEAAVRSLVGDLLRGRALSENKTETGQLLYVWAAEPAQQFSLVRRLEEHEEVLCAKLRDLQSRATSLAMALTDDLHHLPAKLSDAMAALRSALQDQSALWASRVNQVADLGETLRKEDAERESNDAERAFDQLCLQAYELQRQILSGPEGILFTSQALVQYDNGSAIWEVGGQSGENGRTFLLQGLHPQMNSDLASSLQRLPPWRVAVVQVMPPGLNKATMDGLRNGLKAQLQDALASQSPVTQVQVTPVSLLDDQSASPQALQALQLAADKPSAANTLLPPREWYWPLASAMAAARDWASGAMDAPIVLDSVQPLAELFPRIWPADPLVQEGVADALFIQVNSGDPQQALARCQQAVHVYTPYRILHIPANSAIPFEGPRGLLGADQVVFATIDEAPLKVLPRISPPARWLHVGQADRSRLAVMGLQAVDLPADNWGGALNMVLMWGRYRLAPGDESTPGPRPEQEIPASQAQA